MPNLEVILELIARSDKFQSGVDAGKRSLTGFKDMASRTSEIVQNLSRNIGFLGNAAAALSGGLVLKKLFGLNEFLPIDDALLRIRVNLKLTGKELDDFKTKISAVAGTRGIEQGTAFQSAYKLSFVYKPEEILEIMKISDEAADAMKAPYDVVQDRIVQIMKLYRLSAKEAKGVAEALVASRVDVEALDTVMQRLALRGGAKKEYIETLGMLRGLNIAGISSPRVVMQLNETLQAITDKADLLEKSGIKVRKVNKDGTKEWRDQLEVLKDLEVYLDKWKKKISSKEYDAKLDQAFGPNARQRLDFIFGQKENFKKGMEEMANAASLAGERSAAADETWNKQLERVKSHIGGIKSDLSFIYDLAKKPVKFAADHPTATKAAGYAAAGVSTAILGYGLLKTLQTVFGGAGKIKDVLTSGPFGKITTPIPVYVVNKRMDLIDLPGTGKAPGAPVPAGRSVLAKLGTAAKWTGGAAMAGVAGYESGSYLNKQFGDLSGVMSGGKYKGEGWLGEVLYDLVHPEKPEVKNEIKLNIQIDKDGRVTTDNGNKNTSVNVALPRGNFDYDIW